VSATEVAALAQRHEGRAAALVLDLGERRFEHGNPRLAVDRAGQRPAGDVEQTRAIDLGHIDGRRQACLQHWHASILRRALRRRQCTKTPDSDPSALARRRAGEETGAWRCPWAPRPR
jgi:hypothetical protein